MYLSKDVLHSGTLIWEAGLHSLQKPWSGLQRTWTRYLPPDRRLKMLNIFCWPARCIWKHDTHTHSMSTYAAHINTVQHRMPNKTFIVLRRKLTGMHNIFQLMNNWSNNGLIYIIGYQLIMNWELLNDMQPNWTSGCPAIFFFLHFQRNKSLAFRCL